MADWLDTPLKELIPAAEQGMRRGALRRALYYFKDQVPEIEPTPRTLTLFQEDQVRSIDKFGNARTEALKDMLAEHGSNLRNFREAIPQETPFLIAAAATRIDRNRALPIAVGLSRGRKPMDVELREVLALPDQTVINLGLRPTDFARLGYLPGAVSRRDERALTLAKPTSTIEEILRESGELITKIDALDSSGLSKNSSFQLSLLRNYASETINALGKEMASKSQTETIGRA